MLVGTYQLAGNLIMRSKICLAALAATAATAAFASPSFAQTAASDTAQARGLVLQPLSLARVDDLDFGTVLASTTADTVTVNADTGLRSLGGSGGITLVATNPGKRGVFTGAGTPGVVVNITLTPPVSGVLVSGGNSIAAALVLDQSGSTSRAIGTQGTFNVGVGGTFSIAANQPSGLYAADFELTANYP